MRSSKWDLRRHLDLERKVDLTEKTVGFTEEVDSANCFINEVKRVKKLIRAPLKSPFSPSPPCCLWPFPLMSAQDTS